jgi:hypothetical protein
MGRGEEDIWKVSYAEMEKKGGRYFGEYCDECLDDFCDSS